MDERTHLFIGGEWALPATDRRLVMTSPATEQTVATHVAAGSADVDRAVASAKRAVVSGTWRDMPSSERAAALSRLAAEIAARTDAFADVISAEVGTPRHLSPMTQVGLALGALGAYSQLTSDHLWESERIGRLGGRLRVQRRPVGVVGAIVPWNAPLFVAALKLGPALGAGNVVVLKAAPQAASYAWLLADAVLAAGFPPGVVGVLPGGADVGARLVSHPDVDAISFTGSTAVGRRVGAACADDLKRCSLELGGKSAAVVLDDVVLDDATVSGILNGFIANSGQVCAAQTRVLVPRRRRAELVDALSAAADSVTVGDPFDPSTAMGPLISHDHRQAVESHIERAVAGGAIVAAGGTRPDDLERGWYLRPTVLSDVTPDMPVAREELFGPVGAVLAYDDEESAVAIANDSAYGLVARVWTADPVRGEAVASRLDVGSVSLNAAPPVDLAAPFGGVKESGIGRAGGPEGFGPYIEHRTLILPPA